MDKPPFDPNQPFEAAAPQKPVFDPSKPFEAAQTSGSAPQMSAAHAALKGVQDIPTFGFGDEAGGATQAGLLAMARRFPKVFGPIAGFDPKYAAEVGGPNDYQKARDENRAESKAAADQHPAAYYGAGAAAALPLAPVIPGIEAAQGTGWLGRAGVAAANGAAQGALAGAGGSEANSLGGVAKDAGSGMILGGATGGLLSAAGSGIVAGAKALPGTLQRTGVAQAKRVLTGGANHLSGKQTLTDEAVQEVLDSGGMRAFDSTAKVSKRLGEMRDTAGAAYSRIVKTLEDRGIKGPAAAELADELITKGQIEGANTIEPEIPELYRSRGEALMALPQDENGRLALSQAEGVKRGLQAKARYGKYEDTPLNDARSDIASRVRQGIEDEIHMQTQASADPVAQQLGKDFVPAKQRLGRLIEADEAAFKGADQASKRNAFSLRDIILGGGVVGGGMATGNPALMAKGLAVAGGSKLARDYGTSALAVGAYKAGGALQKLPTISVVQQLARTNPGRLAQAIGAPRAAVLSRALREGGDQSFATTHFVMQQTQPDYQEALAHLEDDKQGH